LRLLRVEFRLSLPQGLRQFFRVYPPLRMLNTVNQDDRNTLPVNVCPQRIVINGNFFHLDFGEGFQDVIHNTFGVVAEVTLCSADDRQSDLIHPSTLCWMTMTPHPDSRLAELPADAVVFSDIDNTVVFGASVYHFGWEAYSQGLITWRDVIPALFDQRHFVRSGENEERMANIRQRALALVKGQTVDDFVRVAKATWDTRIRTRLFPEIVSMLWSHRERGHDVFLASASPRELVEVMAHGLGLTGGLGTELHVTEGVFTGDFDGPFLHGEQKAEAVFAMAESLGATRDRLVAYSDSIADLPLLEGVAHPVAVNPDRRLHHIAKERDWPIIWPEATARYRRHRL